MPTKSRNEDTGQILDVSVSFDGTCAKRGFTYRTGVVFVIAGETGELRDYHVLSKECHTCSLKNAHAQMNNFKNGGLHIRLRMSVQSILKETLQQ